MIKTHAILFTTLFAFCVSQRTKEKNYMKPRSTAPTTIDGPYVLYRNDSVFIKYIEESSAIKSVKTDSMPASMRNSINLQVNTDVPGKTFNVQLKQKLSEEKSEYKGIKKMLVLSDIEGNFEAFRKLLQGNQVIDENFNWTFGKDH